MPERTAVIDLDEANVAVAEGAMQESAAIAIPGHLAGVDDEGRLLFVADGATQSLPVAIGVQLSDEELVRAARLERRAIVVAPSGTPERGVLVGLVRERVGAAARDAAANAGLQVKVDGDSVIVSANARMELRCGKARITMHKDGRVEVSGTHLLSRSRGPVRIKGASIALN
jgi:hypothetical protein